VCAKEREREIAVFSTTGVSLFSLFALLLRASWGKSLKRVERKKKKTCARFADGNTGVIKRKKERKNGNRAKCARARVSFAASMLLVLKTHV